MPKIPAICFAIALVFAIAFKSVASTHTNYYAIRGTTVEELRSQMNRYGPIWQGRRHYGRTVWEIEWNYRYQIAGDRCQLIQQTVTESHTVTLPNWTNKASASKQLQQRWNNFIETLQRHENNHIEHGKMAANEIRRMLNSLGQEQECSSLGAIANEKAEAIIKKYNALDEQYDLVTNHGETEGVVL